MKIITYNMDIKNKFMDIKTEKTIYFGKLDIQHLIAAHIKKEFGVMVEPGHINVDNQLVEVKI